MQLMGVERMLKSAVILLAILAIGACSAAASQKRDDSKEITGEALERASKAALEVTKGGRVTDTEVGDEEGYYEVEVTLEDGRQVDVHLNERFELIVVIPDSEEPDNDDDDDEPPAP